MTAIRIDRAKERLITVAAVTARRWRQGKDEGLSELLAAALDLDVALVSARGKQP